MPENLFNRLSLAFAVSVNQPKVLCFVVMTYDNLLFIKNFR